MWLFGRVGFGEVVAKTHATSAVRTASEQLLHNGDPKVAPLNFGSTVIQKAFSLEAIVEETGCDQPSTTRA